MGRPSKRILQIKKMTAQRKLQKLQKSEEYNGNEKQKREDEYESEEEGEFQESEGFAGQRTQEARREWDEYEAIEEIELEEIESEADLEDLSNFEASCAQYNTVNIGEGKAPSAFDILLGTGSSIDWKRSEGGLRSAIYTRDSARTKTYGNAKIRSLAKEARSMQQISTFFKPISTPNDSLAAPEDHNPEIAEDSEIAERSWIDLISALDQYSKDNKKNFSQSTINRTSHVRGYFSLRHNGHSAMDASKIATEILGRGPCYASVIRASARNFIKNNVIPISK